MASIPRSLTPWVVGIPEILPRLAGSLPQLPSISIRLRFPGWVRPHQEQESSTQKSLEIENQAGLEMIPPPFFDPNDNGLVLAVPKKKVSHQKKRQRQLGPGSKQIKEIRNLARCPSCGHYKRAHTLCMHCVTEIRNMWKARDAAENVKESKEPKLDPVDKRVLYPGRIERSEQKQLREKEYLYNRPRTLPYEKKV